MSETSLVLTAKQSSQLKAIRAHFGKKSTITRAELNEYAKSQNVAYPPGFFVREDVFKARDKEGNIIRGLFKLVSAGSFAVKKDEKPAKVAAPKKEKTSKPDKKQKKTKAATNATPMPVLADSDAASRAALLEEDNEPVPEYDDGFGENSDED